MNTYEGVVVDVTDGQSIHAHCEVVKNVVRRSLFLYDGAALLPTSRIANDTVAAMVTRRLE